MKYLILIFLFGCAVEGAYRPMQVGMVWEEKEKFHKTFENGTVWIKTCKYTKVTENGEYEYDCAYNQSY